MSKRTKHLLKENNEVEKQIQNAENKAILTDIIVYIRSANISPYDQEKIRRDIGQMILDGEKRGETSKDIIGEDYKLFCDSVIAEIPKLSKKEWCLSSLRDVFLSLNVLLIIWLALDLIEQRITTNTFPYVTVTAGNIICGLLIITGSFLLFYAFSKNTFHIKGDVSSKKESFILFSIVFCFLLVCMGVNVFVKHPLFHAHVLALISGIAMLFVLYKILDAKLD